MSLTLNRRGWMLLARASQAAAWVGGMGNKFRLQCPYVSRESGSEKLPTPFPVNPGTNLPTAREIHGSGLHFAPLLLCVFALTVLSGCVSAHKKGRTIHERFDYQVVQSTGSDPIALLTCHEIWRDEWTGGGRAFLADPKASELVSIHTNQIALGGYSSLSIGSFQSEVSTNGIVAAGNASSQIIQGIGSAVGQAVNKSVTGMPLK